MGCNISVPDNGLSVVSSRDGCCKTEPDLWYIGPNTAITFQCANDALQLTRNGAVVKSGSFSYTCIESEKVSTIGAPFINDIFLDLTCSEPVVTLAPTHAPTPVIPTMAATVSEPPSPF